MSGVFDLTDPGVRLPARISLDTTVLITRLILPKVVSPQYLTRFRQVRRFFELLKAQRAAGFVTSTTYQEFLHAAIRARYTSDLTTHAASIGGKKWWELLYKARPDLLQGYEADLKRALEAIPRLGAVVLQPTDLSSLPPGRRLEDELIDLVIRFQLLSSDAAILLETRRAGLDAIVTEDPDFRRAATEVDVYTWL